MIPLVRVDGSHREAGAQLGAALAEQIRRDLAPPELVQRALPCREATLEHLPGSVEELDAAAVAAGVDPLRLLAAGRSAPAGRGGARPLHRHRPVQGSAEPRDLCGMPTSRG